MVLGYKGGDKLKVPIEAFDRIQKHTSAEGARPQIDRLGSGSWERVKKRVKKAMRDMAQELLKLYAERKARPGHAFTGESPWQQEFEEAFEYEETPDQAAGHRRGRPTTWPPRGRWIGWSAATWATARPRWPCARPCAAVLDGKQVAILAPTTVLAFQHWKTFRKRFAPFPVMVEMVSRFRKPREIKATLGRVSDGGVDILDRAPTGYSRRTWSSATSASW